MIGLSGREKKFSDII